MARKFILLSTLLFLVLNASGTPSVPTSAHSASVSVLETALTLRTLQDLLPEDAATWRSSWYPLKGDPTMTLFAIWLAIACTVTLLAGLKPAVKVLARAYKSTKRPARHSLVLACLLLQPFHTPIAEAATFMYPNGTSIVDFPHDVVFKSGARAGGPSGILFDTQNKADITFNAGPDHAVQLVTSRFDLVGTTLNLTGLGLVNFDQILSQSLLINGTLITTTHSDVDIILSPKGGGTVRIGKTLDVRGVTLLLDDDQISGDKIEGGVISAVTITNLTTTQLNIEIIGTDVKLAAGKTLDVSEGTLQLRDGQISGDKIRGGTIDDVTITTLTAGEVKANTLTGNMSLAAGKILDVSQGTLTLAPNQISGDSINGGTIDVVTITALTAGTVKSNTLTTISGDISLNPVGSITLASGKTLDVSQGVLQLADGQISGDKIKGGSILVTNLTATRINVDTIGTTVKIAPGESLDVRGATLLVDQMSVDNLKLDGNTVRSTSGDLELMCPAGQVVKVGDKLAVGKLVMKGNTLNTTDHHTLLLAPHGSGSVKVAEGKTLDLRGVTLLLDDDAIRGDKVDGGTIHNITIVQLTSGTAVIGNLELGGQTLSSTGDIKFEPGSGKKTVTLRPFEVQDLKLQGTTISTTTGVPVTINNMTCPVATFNQVTAGKLKLDGHTITATNANGNVEIAADGTGKVILHSNTELASGKTITGSEATFTSVKTSTISTTSGDLTINPTGSNVKIASSKTLDLTGATLKLDSNSVTLPNRSVTTDQLADGAVSTSKLADGSVTPSKLAGDVKVDLSSTIQNDLTVNGSVDATEGFHDSHAWSSGTTRKAQLSLGTNSGGFGGSFFCSGPMSAQHFEGYDPTGVPPGNMKDFQGAVFDGRFVYFVPNGDGGSGATGRVLRYDTQQSFTSSASWAGHDSTDTHPGNMKGFQTGVFDGRYVYMIPCFDGTGYSGRVLRYDTTQPFTSCTSWTGYDASETGPGNMKGFRGGIFDGQYVYCVPYVNGSPHGRVLRYDTRQNFTSSSSWSGYDASTTPPGDMRGFIGAVFDGQYIYFMPSQHSPGVSSGKVLRYDTVRSFFSSDSWAGYDASGTSPGNMKGFAGGAYDGRFVYFAGYQDTAYHGKILRYDTLQSFVSSTSWSGYDASATYPGNMRGFMGALFDGRYVYMIPYYDGSSTFGRFLRYDTSGAFTSASSWSGIDASGVGSGSMIGFAGAVFDGRFMYMATIFTGRVLRYDTRSPQPRPSIQQIASNSDLFISSQSNIGIGTISPSQKLHVEGSLGVTDKVGVGTVNPSTSLDVKGTARADHVEAQTSLTVGANTTSLGNGEAVHVDGGVGAKGGFRDSHAWLSETARRSQLAIGLNSGGFGGYANTGGQMRTGFFEGYDASNVPPGNMKGFNGAIFDGRFVYFVPHHYGSSLPSGNVLRYDTQMPFTSRDSWSGYDASSTDPGNMKGFTGAVFDGQHVIFIPRTSDPVSGRFLRYDTQQSFISSSSWIGYDASGTSPGNMKRFYGGVFDGRYAYFAPHEASTGGVLRYDTFGPFTLNTSWTGFDASATSPGNMKPLMSAVFDGRFVYFVPPASAGGVLRYDTQQPFASNNSWTGHDPSAAPPGGMKGFVGGVFDGRYVYFTPAGAAGVLRYDTYQSFTSNSSWIGHDASGISPGNMKAFSGAAFDGRYIYYASYSDVTGASGKVLRYDVQQQFTSNSSWSGIDPSSTSPGNMKGFIGAVFDGRHVYFVPEYDGSYHGRVLRYDTRAPQPRPSLAQIATSSDLFIASNGSVGIGTKSPGERLSVEGNAFVRGNLEVTGTIAGGSGSIVLHGDSAIDGSITATGGFRDSHAWDSQSAAREHISIGNNGGGGVGSSVAVGGPMTSSFFDGYDASGTSPGNMRAFVGAVFDGRYVYFVPMNIDGTYHGRVLRYDTQRPFHSSAGWEGYDASGTSPGNMKGFMGAVFDGRYVYFVPHSDGSYHGRVLRFDTGLPFSSSSSWSGYDARETNPGDMVGFFGAVFDGQHVYFVPNHDTAAGLSGRALRYDISKNFSSSNSWEGYDAVNTSPGSMKGFCGGVFDGRYVYFVPWYDPSFHGRVLRYDTQGSFISSGSWSGYDASSTSPGSMVGFMGAVFDSRYVYFVPWGGGSSGRVLRFDTKGDFTSSSSWSGYDASGTSPGSMTGYIGGVFDGHSIYFVPNNQHGRVLRYDTHGVFAASDSWSGLDASATSPGSMKGYYGGVFDGRYVYMAPNHDGSLHHGKVLRYDTRAPQPRPSIQQIASNKDLFIASDGKVGIGTTSPDEMLHVVGNIKATGTVSADTVSATTTCCGSDIRLKKDVTSLCGALSTIKKMRGIRYRWKSTGEPSIGFVAQELEQVVPEVVVTGSDGYKAVDYGKLSAVLAVAVQEVEDKHAKETEELRNKMSKMEHQHAALIQVCVESHDVVLIPQRLETLEQQVKHG